MRKSTKIALGIGIGSLVGAGLAVLTYKVKKEWDELEGFDEEEEEKEEETYINLSTPPNPNDYNIDTEPKAGMEIVFGKKNRRDPEINSVVLSVEKVEDGVYEISIPEEEFELLGKKKYLLRYPNMFSFSYEVKKTYTLKKGDKVSFVVQIAKLAKEEEKEEQEKKEEKEQEKEEKKDSPLSEEKTEKVKEVKETKEAEETTASE